MSKERIKNLVVLSGIYDCLTDPYDKASNGDYYSSIMYDVERIIDLVVKECANICDEHPSYGGRMLSSLLIQKYGIKDV